MLIGVRSVHVLVLGSDSIVLHEKKNFTRVDVRCVFIVY